MLWFSSSVFRYMSGLKKFQYLHAEKQQGGQSSWSRGSERECMETLGREAVGSPMLCGAGRLSAGLCLLLGMSWGTVGGPWVAQGRGTDVVTGSHHSGDCIEHSLLKQTPAGKQERQSSHDRGFLRIGAGGGNEWSHPEYAGVTWLMPSTCVAPSSPHTVS